MKLNKHLLVVFLLIAISSLCMTTSFAKVKKLKPDSKIAFNFVDVEIPSVIKFISEITGYNFIFDERVKGKITIIAPTKLSIQDSFNLFTSILTLKGYTIIPSGPQTYKIIPSSLAKQQGKISVDEDEPINEGYITKLLPTKYIKVDDALQFLRPVISRDGHIAAFGPQNLLLIVDSAVNIGKIVSILELIDQPSLEEEASQINVYFLEHADALDMAQVLQEIIKDLQTAHKTSLRKKKKKDGSNGVPALSVTPDKSTNSLIIVAPPDDYNNIADVIKTLDRRRKQVYVEAMIIEASVDKLKELGTKWRGAVTHNDEPIFIGGVGNVGLNAIQSIVSGLAGFSAGGMGNFMTIPFTAASADGTVSSQTLTAPGFAAIFSLNVFDNVINVLSTPQILTSDNEEAEIHVGENVPFISSRERNETTSNTLLSTIERQDVGITLRMTPQITDGDYVKLDIFQEISSVVEASENILTSVGPTTTTRSTKTSVSVKDGHTVVIGGLMEEKSEDGTNKTPILGDIPVLGWLFKSKTITKNKTNLLVFLSPHIVKEPTQLAQITKKKHTDFVVKEKYYNGGEILVKFREDIPEDRIKELIDQKNALIITYFESINVYHLKLSSSLSVEDAVTEFGLLDEVLYAEPNYRMKIQSNQLPNTNLQHTPVPGSVRDK
jgi:general secretion pathway protein D